MKDTDRDGLIDGYNDMGIGELTLGHFPSMQIQIMII